MTDQKEVKFIDGLIVKAPRDGAPDFIKLCLSIKRLDLIAWLQQQDGEWVNADVKEARSGKLYAAVDDWKPTPRADGPQSTRGGGPSRPAPSSGPVGGDDFEPDNIPFATNRGGW